MKNGPNQSTQPPVDFVKPTDRPTCLSCNIPLGLAVFHHRNGQQHMKAFEQCSWAFHCSSCRCFPSPISCRTHHRVFETTSKACDSWNRQYTFCSGLRMQF